MNQLNLPPQVSSRGNERTRTMLWGRRHEREELDRLVARARSGRSGVLVVRGEPGIGKTALLDYLMEQASGCTIARATGVQADTELAFAGLQQLLGSILGPLERLPDPQREAMAVAFGLWAGPAPDRFLVGLAVLGLLAEVAEEQPLVCVVDDAQWLDRSSAQTLAFVGRRLLGESVALVLALREPADDETFDRLPELIVRGLSAADAHGLLESVIAGRVDDRVLDRMVAESRGNPLALVELPYALSAAELAGGFGVSGSMPVSERVEQIYVSRVRDLPLDTQRLLLLAAAEPVGDPQLLLRAADLVGLGVQAAAPAELAGLLELDTQVRFRHPLVRSAVYSAASLADRQAAHRALAEATDAQVDPDRRAWHRAHAALAPDEAVAGELEQSAGRARARGGLAAAAAFLERAAALTPDPGRRARRALEAAATKQLAGAPQAALRLLATAETGPLDEFDRAMLQRLHGQIALDLRRAADALPLLLDAATRLELIDPGRARDTYLEAFRAASVAGRVGGRMLDVATAARAAPPRQGAPSAVDLLLDGLAIRFTDGYAASAPILKRALIAVGAEADRALRDMRWPWQARRLAPDLFDEDAWRLFATRTVAILRDAGALVLLPLALNYLATLRSYEGHLDAATVLLEEADAISEATGSAPIVIGRLMHAGYRGDEAPAVALLEESEAAAIARGDGVVLTFGEYARAVLYNGLGRYEAALAPAQSASSLDELHASAWSLPELVEAAARCGRTDLAASALERLSERTRASGTEWALGVEARSRALLCERPSAEGLYREAIDRLGRCRVVFELARAHLLYGEWLRRARRRVDAREQLRRAQEVFASMGAEAFGARAGRELVATGETARKRTIETTDDLTPHEARIARMARDGASNQQIANQLFVSRKTVEYHLHNVFRKLGIRTREHLDRVLPGD